MPNLYVFHQNMLQFGGGNPARNFAYLIQFTNIRNALTALPAPAASSTIAAGFTEIKNAGAGAAAVNNLKNAILGPGNHTCYVVACGCMALSGPEYVAVLLKTAGAYPRIILRCLGRIHFVAAGQQLTLINDVAPLAITPAWLARLEPRATIDYRGIVYAILELRTGPGVPVQTIGVAWFHNLYTFVNQKILIAGKLPQIVSIIANQVTRYKPPAQAASHVYLGGDFNVWPIPIRASTTRTVYCSSAGTAAPLAWPINPNGSVAIPGGTTWSGNLYDYWYTDFNPAAPPPVPYIPGGIALPIATADSRTMDKNLMSDHAAVLLQIC